MFNKIGFVVTTHYSVGLRPNGKELIQGFVESVHETMTRIPFGYKIYVYDNASVEPLGLPKDKKVEVTYIKDQTKRGLTGTWNDGVKKAFEDGCGVVVVSNDDVRLTGSFIFFLADISNHMHNDISIFGPVSNGILGGVQKQSGPVKKQWDLTGNEKNMVNGFLFGLTKSAYDKFKDDKGFLFDEENHPWGGNEEEFQKRIWKEGGRSYVLGRCWVYHEKIRGWKKLMK